MKNNQKCYCWRETSLSYLVLLLIYPLYASGADLVWEPQGGSPQDWTWQVGTPPAWKSGDAVLPFSNGDTVSFASTETNIFADRTVVVAGEVRPAVLRFSGDRPYTFVGDPISIGTALFLEGSGVLSFHVPVSVPQTTLSSGKLGFQTPFHAGDFIAAGGTVAALGNKKADFSFSVPEGQSQRLNCNWERGASPGITLHKRGKGSATLDIRKIDSALGGLSNGRICVEEGTLVGTGYGWGSRSSAFIFEVSGGATLRSEYVHALGDYYSAFRLHLLPGATFRSGGAQYLSNANPGLWMKGNAQAYGELRCPHDDLYVKVEGRGNFIENLNQGLGKRLHCEVLEAGEVYVNNVSPRWTTIKTGPGTLLLGSRNLSDGEEVLRVEAGTLVATNNFRTLLAGDPVIVSDGALFVNGNPSTFWLENTPSTTTGSGAFKGSFGCRTAPQNFTGGLRVVGDFTIRDEGFDADYTGLTLNGTVNINHGVVRPFSFPPSLKSEEIVAAQVVAGAATPANITGSRFPVRLDLLPGAHTLIDIKAGNSLVTADAGYLFAADSVLHLSTAEGVIPDGTYPLFGNVTQMPETLPQIRGYLASVQRAEWILEGGNLEVRIVTSGSLGNLVWRAEEGTPDNQSWSGESANWEKVGESSKVPFSDGATVLFDGQEGNPGGFINVGAGIIANGITFLGDKSYTLTGEKIGGTGTLLKGGSGTLALEGKGVSEQKIVITNGVLKLGEAASEDALGGESAPIEISGTGTLDINYTSNDPNDRARNGITNRKLIRFEGRGANGAGALVNNGPAYCYRNFGKLEMTGDATIGGTKRFDLRALDHNGSNRLRSTLSGLGHTLTVINPAAFVWVDSDVDIGKIVIRDGGALRVEETTALQAEEGIDLADGGTLNSYHYTGTWDFPIRSISGENQIYLEERSTLTQRGPVTVNQGSTLSLKGGELKFHGSVTNSGTLRVLDGAPVFAAPVVSDSPIEIKDGAVQWYFHTPASGMALEGTREVKLDGGRLEFKLASAGERRVENLTFSKNDGNPGGSLLFTTSDPLGRVTLSNVVAQAMGRLSVGTPWDFGRLSLESGCDLGVTSLFLGELAENPKSSSLRLKAGSKVSVRDNGAVRIGHWSGSSLEHHHRLSIEGGELIAPGSLLSIGYHSPSASMAIEGGVVDVRGITLREVLRLSSGVNQKNTCETFVMKDGLLKVGPSGLITSRSYFGNDAGYFMNGGELRSTGDWGTIPYSRIIFGDRPMTVNIGPHLLNYNSALQGRGDLLLIGEAGGRFQSIAPHVRGSYDGHLTLANRGTTRLDTVAALVGGITLEEGCTASLDIRGNRGYVRFGVFSGVTAKECAHAPWSATYLDSEMPFVHQALAGENCAYLYAGEFYVSEEQAGTWTFAKSFDDQVYLSIDAATVIDDTVWNATLFRQCELSAGWHAFRLAVQNGGGGTGPENAAWKQKQMGVGWASRALDTADAAGYTRFSPETLPMRPGISEGERKIRENPDGNSVRWYHRTEIREDWKTMTDWDSFSYLDSLSPLSRTDWPEGSGSINHFAGWFYVAGDQTGIWKFWGSYDDMLAVWIDGQDTGIEGSREGVMASDLGFDLSEGWHRFDIRAYDYGGKWGPWNPAQGAAVQYSVDGQPRKAFDESTLRLRATLALPNTEYGYIGGPLVLKEGAVLTNTSQDGPCSIRGTLQGSGSLNGDFVFAPEGTWKVSGTGKGLDGIVRFGENRSGHALAELRNILAVFSEKPLRTTFEMEDALGLTPETVSEIVVKATDPSGLASYPLHAELRDGRLFLINESPSGTLLILQ